MKSKSSSKGLSSFTGAGWTVGWATLTAASEVAPGVPDFLESTDLDDLKLDEADDEAELALFLGGGGGGGGWLFFLFFLDSNNLKRSLISG